MKRTFKALEEKYPGYKIVDFNFTVLNKHEEVNLETFDQDLAAAIREAKECSIGSM